MEQVQAAPFRPWVGDLQLVGVTYAIAALSTLFVWNFPTSALRIYGICMAITFTFAGTVFMRRLMRRVHGQATEAAALRRLGKLLCDGWSLQRNVMLDHGDLDGLLQGPDAQAFALEIKSKTSLRILKGSLWRKDKLVNVKGQPVDPKILRQAKNNAFQMNAFPVLWFPDAREVAFASDVEQVIVVCGPPAYLLKVLGIPKKSWWAK